MSPRRYSIVTLLLLLIILFGWVMTHARTYWFAMLAGSRSFEVYGQRGTITFDFSKNKPSSFRIAAGALNEEISKEDIFGSRAYSATSFKVNRAGFGLIWQPYAPYTIAALKVPFWAILLALFMPAALRSIRRRRRRRLNLCENCGYDLRASVAMCPECGSHKTRGHMAVAQPAQPVL